MQNMLEKAVCKIEFLILYIYIYMGFIHTQLAANIWYFNDNGHIEYQYVCPHMKMHAPLNKHDLLIIDYYQHQMAKASWQLGGLNIFRA